MSLSSSPGTFGSAAGLRAARTSESTRVVARILAAGLPFVGYVATASGYAHWLDSGEFVAQAADFGIAHPPGQPLAGLVNGLFARLPLGSISFRVALASASMAALAALAFHEALARTLRIVGAPAAVRVPLGVGATWLLAGSVGWWQQAVRPEVYALQAALVFAALERVLAFEERYPRPDPRPLYTGAFYFGLALTNHHFLAFLMLPAIAGSLARAVRANGPRVMGWSAVFASLGLTVYLYLPLRARAEVMLNLGDPRTSERFFWVVSAQTFQGNTGDGVPQPLGERFADVAVQLVEGLHPITILVALLGFYLSLRTLRARPAGALWLLVFAIYAAARAWLGFVRSNPDALGYLMPAMGALVAAAACGIGVVTKLFEERGARPILLGAFGALVPIAALAHAAVAAPTVSLASFTATDLLDDPLRRDLPPRAVVFSYVPQTLFRLWGGEAVEHTRPDVTIVPMPLVHYPELVNELVERDESLRDSMRTTMLDGAPSEAALESLALRRPVLLEPDLRLPEYAWRTTVPRGYYLQALGDPATRADQESQGREQRALFEGLDARLTQRDRGDHETRAERIWALYCTGLFYASQGLRDEARWAVAEARRIEPAEETLIALEAALAEGEGPIDITPFRVDAADAEAVPRVRRP